MQPTDTIQPDVRAAAIGAIRRRRALGLHLLIYLTVNAFLVVVWWSETRGAFWPVFTLVGWGVGLIFQAVQTIGGRPTDAQIRRQIERS